MRPTVSPKSGRTALTSNQTLPKKKKKANKYFAEEPALRQAEIHFFDKFQTARKQMDIVYQLNTQSPTAVRGVASTA